MSLPRRSSPSASPEPPLEGLAADLKRLLAGVPSRCRWFRYEELYESINHFSPENLVGKGAHSRVYKGSLASGQQVAIKLCKASKEASKDFLREVDIITKLQHDRIVPLMGVCVEGRNLVSVYRYLPRGSLEDNLHGKKSKPTLPWEKRYRAAVGVAEALSYVLGRAPERRSNARLMATSVNARQYSLEAALLKALGGARRSQRRRMEAGCEAGKSGAALSGGGEASVRMIAPTVEASIPFPFCALQLARTKALIL